MFDTNLKFKTIVMDVPWPIGTMELKKYPKAVPYPTMSIEEISNIPIDKIADDDCILFFWTTHTFLPDAFKIIERYGFKYYVTLSWDKISGLTHQGFFRVTEFVLVAYKGKLTQAIKERGKAIPCLFREAKTKHSKKPKKFDEIVIRSTFEPRADIFARTQKHGYAYTFGNDDKLEDLVSNTITSYL